MRISEFLERFVFTRKCAACGELLSYDDRAEAFCSECRMRWDVLKTKECHSCGRAMCECICMTGALSGAGALCHHKVVAYSQSESVIHNPVMLIKRNKNPIVVGFLAAQMLSVLGADKELPKIDAESAVICFVPRSKRAVKKHGVDQSAELARELSEQSGVPLVRAFERVKGGKKQKKLSAAERVKNVKKLFKLCKGATADIEGKTVILVDDVVTTGASMAACVPHLIRARACAVICLSVASTQLSK